jgi:DNA-directed RNA polymerase I subunit RPA1
VCRAAAKLKLLEYGLLNPANVLDELNLGDQNMQRKEETVEGFEKRLDQHVRIHLSKSSSARRGDYKDGPVYQARKRVIEDFIKAAQSNSRRCSRSECGA